MRGKKMRRRGYKLGRRRQGIKKKKRERDRKNKPDEGTMRKTTRCAYLPADDDVIRPSPGTLNITACYADSVKPFPTPRVGSLVNSYVLSHKLSLSPNETIVSPSRLIQNLTFTS